MRMVPFTLAVLAAVLIAPAFAAAPNDEVLVTGFEQATLPVSPNADGGKPPVFQRWTQDPHSGQACLRLDYTGGNNWGNLQMPVKLTGFETAVQFWVRKAVAEPNAGMHIWFFEKDGDAWLSPEVKIALLGAGWQKVQIPLTDFSYQPRGDGNQDLASANRMLIGCNYANFTVDLDDISLVMANPHKRQFGFPPGPADFTFDLAKPHSDWWATLAAEYDPIQFMPEDTSPNLGRRGMNDSWWAVESERVRKMGLQGVRLWFQIDWWEPFNHHTADSRAAEVAGKTAGPYAGFDVDGPRMQSVYRFLDMCQKYHVEVMLDFGWKMDLPTRYWLAPASQLARSNPDIKDPTAHAESLVALLKYLHDVRKYTCITHITLGNEFEYNYPEMYPEMQKMLVAAGLRGQYIVCGLESNGGIQESHELVKAHPNYIDVHTLHNYSTMDLGKLVKSDIAALGDLKGTEGAPQFFGNRGRVLYTEFALGPSDGVGIALAVAGSAREGAYGTGGWRLGDQHLVSVCDMGNGSDRFDHGLHKWGTWRWIPWMEQPRPSYFATSLLTRYIPAHSSVFVSEAANPAIPCVCFEKNGSLSLLVVNENKTPLIEAIHLGSSSHKPFHRHLFDAAALPAGDYDTIIPSDKEFAPGDILDTLPGHSFAIYTTLPDYPQIEVSPYVSEARPTDVISLKAKLLSCAGPVRWSVDGGPANGTVSGDGIYHAPAGLPSIDPVIVRATCVADARGVGLAVISFSGKPTDPPDRPSVAITPKVGQGSSRMFDLGVDYPLNARRSLAFQMSNYGPGMADYAITSTEPWLIITPARGQIAAGQAQVVDVQAIVDTHGLKPDTWYRGYININSPRGLGHDQLEVFFKTAQQ